MYCPIAGRSQGASEHSAYWEQPFSQPYFDNSSRRDVTSTVGQTAHLHCRVRNLGDRAVRKPLLSDSLVQLGANFGTPSPSEKLYTPHSTILARDWFDKTKFARVEFQAA